LVAVIRPGEVGVKQSLGVLATEVKSQGTVFTILIGKVIKLYSNKQLRAFLSLPSKEGLSITSQISILYKLDKRVPDII
jgi:hypothetical protein